MKIFELSRLTVGLSCKVILAYIGEKFLHVSLVRGQKEIISYFNALARLNLYHKSIVGAYYHVKSPIYGEFYLRKPFSSDYRVFEQIFVDKEYLLLAQSIEQYCSNDTIAFIDGGANIGLTTVFINHFLKGKKMVKSILVEPFEENLEIARLNVQLQNISQANFELAGLYNKSCYLKIDRGFRDGMEWSVQIDESSEITDLRAIEINDIEKKYNVNKIDVLKLDIEGAEKFLFENEEYADRFLQKVSIIAIELHDEYDIANKILHTLKKNKFRLQKYGEMHVGVKEHLL